MAKQKKILQEKYDTLTRQLEGDHVLVHVNPHAADVQLPPQLSGDHTVTLKISRLFQGALEVTPERITAELLFDGAYFTCIIPLHALWGCTSDKGKNIIWPESTPQEVLQDILHSALEGKSSVESKSKRKAAKKGSHLRRVK